MARVDPQFRLRIPEDLFEWLEAQAKRNRRSKNGEIVFRLEQSRQLAAKPATTETSEIPAAAKA